MKCLNVEELKEAYNNKTPVTWHPDYKDTSETSGPIIISGVFNLDIEYEINLKTLDGIVLETRFIDGNGYGIASCKPMFILANENANIFINIVAPRNNDGLEKCFWCSIPTKKRGGGRYDVCPKCGR